jgi:AraC-like DNA-binding protein
MTQGENRANASGAHSPRGPASIRFSTEALPEPDRVEIFRELCGQKMIRLEVEPLPGPRFRVDMLAQTLAGLDIAWSLNSPVRVNRTRQLLSDGNDKCIFRWSDTASSAEHMGRQMKAGAGDAVILSGCDPGSIALDSAAQIVGFSFPRAVLGSLLRDSDAWIARPIPGQSGSLQLLIRYLRILRDEPAAAAPEVQRLAVLHIYDLLAIALGATPDAAEVARERGVHAARLRVVKADIADHVSDGDLSIADVAARHRLKPRYVQRLFESEGTTFTQFVCDRRLDAAYRMLASRRFDHKRIGDIAFEAGFNDLSYFNRAFRRRFEASPPDLRKSTF